VLQYFICRRLLQDSCWVLATAPACISQTGALKGTSSWLVGGWLVRPPRFRGGSCRKAEPASLFWMATDLHAFARRVSELATELDERVDASASEAGVQAELALWEHQQTQGRSTLERSLQEFLGHLRQALGMNEAAPVAAEGPKVTSRQQSPSRTLKADPRGSSECRWGSRFTAARQGPKDS